MARRRRKVDRLSNLPEEIICHILSFLPTVDAVKASLVSPKFSNLWKHMTNIRVSHRSKYPETKLRKFVKAVGKVLLETRCIDEFSIELFYYRSTYSHTIRRRLSNCVSAAVAKHVKKLVIFNDYDPKTAASFELPSCIFTCNSLEVLKVRKAIIKVNPSKICLPNLRILCWEYIELPDDVSFNRIISGCSSLHGLYLKPYAETGYDNLEVCSPALKRLTIIMFGINEGEYRLKIDAPALKYLRLKRIMFTSMSMETSSSLTKAKIHLGSPSCGLRTIDNLIGALSNVKLLELWLCKNRLDANGDSIVWPMFPNLTSLTLLISSDKFDIMKDLLQKLPRIESLAFTNTYFNFRSNVEESIQIEGQPEILEYIRLKLGEE